MIELNLARRDARRISIESVCPMCILHRLLSSTAVSPVSRNFYKFARVVVDWWKVRVAGARCPTGHVCPLGVRIGFDVSR